MARNNCTGISTKYVQYSDLIIDKMEDLSLGFMSICDRQGVLSQPRELFTRMRFEPMASFSQGRAL